MSRCFFIIAQTRQFPTMSAMTSMECIVAMAMPDDWSMTECCRCYTVTRPSWFNEKIKKNEFLATKLIIGVNRKRKQKWQSLNVRDIRCVINISSFHVSYVHIKGAKTWYLQIIYFFGLIIFLPRNLVRGTSVLRSTRVLKCMQAFSEGARIIDIISASDWVDLLPCAIISLLIPMTLFSSQAQKKMVLVWSKWAPLSQNPSKRRLAWNKNQPLMQ